MSPLFVLAGTITPASDPRIMSLNNATDPHVVTWQQLKVCIIYKGIVFASMLETVCTLWILACVLILKYQNYRGQLRAA